MEVCVKIKNRLNITKIFTFITFFLNIRKYMFIYCQNSKNICEKFQVVAILTVSIYVHKQHKLLTHIIINLYLQ